MFLWIIIIKKEVLFGDVKVMEIVWDINYIIKLFVIVVKGNIYYCEVCIINLRKEYCKILRRIFKFILYRKFIFLRIGIYDVLFWKLLDFLIFIR